MNDLPKEFIASSCEGKQQLSCGIARQVARRMNRNGRNKQAYRCSVCGHWHVGARQKKRQAR